MTADTACLSSSYKVGWTATVQKDAGMNIVRTRCQEFGDGIPCVIHGQSPRGKVPGAKPRQRLWGRSTMENELWMMQETVYKEILRRWWVARTRSWRMAAAGTICCRFFHQTSELLSKGMREQEADISGTNCEYLLLAGMHCCVKHLGLKTWLHT